MHGFINTCPHLRVILIIDLKKIISAIHIISVKVKNGQNLKESVKVTLLRANEY